jgi:hypothetical protein
MTGVGASEVRRPWLLDPAHLADGGAAGDLLDSSCGIPAPLLAVDLDSVPTPSVVAAAARAAGESDRILVGVATLWGSNSRLRVLTCCFRRRVRTR